MGPMVGGRGCCWGCGGDFRLHSRNPTTAMPHAGVLLGEGCLPGGPPSVPRLSSHHLFQCSSPTSNSALLVHEMLSSLPPSPSECVAWLCWVPCSPGWVPLNQVQSPCWMELAEFHTPAPEGSTLVKVSTDFSWKQRHLISHKEGILKKKQK